MYGNIEDQLFSELRTTKLWIQNMDYVRIMRQFVWAARSGDWNLNLISIQRMVILSAATGHINYAKSGCLSLELMMDLPNKQHGCTTNLLLKDIKLLEEQTNFGQDYGLTWR